jgi:hypothetical protein
MNKHAIMLTWKQLLLASVVIAVLCSANDIDAERSLQIDFAAERSVEIAPPKVEFARFPFSGNDELDIEQYCRLSLWKKPPLQPAPEPIKFQNEKFKTIAVRNLAAKEPLFFSERKVERIIKLGQTMYIRPALGFEHEKGSENFGVEIGLRYLF